MITAILITVLLTFAAVTYLVVEKIRHKKRTRSFREGLQSAKTGSNTVNRSSGSRFDPLLQSLRVLVKNNQTEDGFVFTDIKEKPAILTLLYNEFDHDTEQVQIKAVKVNKYDTLEIIVDSIAVKYTKDTVSEAEEIRPSNKFMHGQWLDVKSNDHLFYMMTVHNLTKTISKYLEEKPCA